MKNVKGMDLRNEVRDLVRKIRRPFSAALLAPELRDYFLVVFFLLP